MTYVLPHTKKPLSAYPHIPYPFMATKTPQKTQPRSPLRSPPLPPFPGSVLAALHQASRVPTAGWSSAGLGQ